MQVETVGDTTVTSSSIREKLERPTLSWTAQTLEAYDGLKLCFKGITIWDTTSNCRIYSKLPQAVMRSNKYFGFFGRNLAPTKYSVHGLSRTLSTDKGRKTQRQGKTEACSPSTFLQNKQNSVAMQEEVRAELQVKVRQAIRELSSQCSRAELPMHHQSFGRKK